MVSARILMGVVGRPHGVRGLVHVHSYMDEPSAIAGLGPLYDERGAAWTIAWRGEGVAELRDASGKPVADRTSAEKLVNMRLHVDRETLPEPDEDDFYLADLVGMQAVDSAGKPLGQIAAVHDYGAGASLEITREAASPLIVPFTRIVVPEIDIQARRLVVLPPDEIELREDAA
jgi:16S rRNA processing protein RimM